MDGNFYTLDAADGKLKWKFATQGEHCFTKSNYCGISGGPVKDPFDFILSSPVVDNNTVFFGSSDGNIYALDITSGKKLWSYKTGDVVHSSPAVYKGKVYVGGWDSFLYCLDAFSGKLIWKLPTGTDKNIWVMTGIQSSPAISDGTVYFGSRDGNLYAADADSGKVKWKYGTSSSWVLTSPAVDSNTIYFGTSDTKKFIAADINGKAKYEIPMNGYVYSSPALYAGSVYIGCFNGSLYSINADKGSVNWIFCTEANKTDPCDMLTDKGQIRSMLNFTSPDAFRSSVERFYSVGSIISSPVICNGVLYFGSTDGNLYALIEGSENSESHSHVIGN
jgi:outer membrane protein assembly factor BamB